MQNGLLGAIARQSIESCGITGLGPSDVRLRRWCRSGGSQAYSDGKVAPQYVGATLKKATRSKANGVPASTAKLRSRLPWRVLGACGNWRRHDALGHLPAAGHFRILDLNGSLPASLVARMPLPGDRSDQDSACRRARANRSQSAKTDEFFVITDRLTATDGETSPALDVCWHISCRNDIEFDPNLSYQLVHRGFSPAVGIICFSPKHRYWAPRRAAGFQMPAFLCVRGGADWWPEKCL